MCVCVLMYMDKKDTSVDSPEKHIWIWFECLLTCCVILRKLPTVSEPVSCSVNGDNNSRFDIRIK